MFISGILGILIFLSKDAKAGMDKMTKYLGSIMIVVVLYVAIKSKPPVGDAINGIVHPGVTLDASNPAAGALNGLILPITLLTILVASRNKAIVGEDYKHPTILIVLGIGVVLLTGFSGVKALPSILTMFG